MSKELMRLRRKKTALIEKARHVVDIVDERGDGFTSEERSDYDQFMADIQLIQGDIERRQNLINMDGDDTDDIPTPKPIGMSAKEVRRYSLRRAIKAAAERNWRGAELEFEASQATAKQLKLDPQGFYVPYDWVVGDSHQVRTSYGYRYVEARDLNVGTPTAGGNLVATDLLASSFIDLLRNRMVLQTAGAIVLANLQGDIAIPRQTGAATTYWVTEGNAPTEGQQTIDQVSMTPHTIGAFTDYTRKLLKQSSIDVERMIRNDLALQIALGIDYAGLHGDDSVDANQPDGVETYADVTSVVGGTNGAAPDWADVVGLETAVSSANADMGRLAYITSAKARGKLKQTEKASSTAQFIWTEQNNINGYTGYVSNQVRDDRAKGSGTNLTTIFFGNWGDLVMGMWGPLDILVDPYTASTTGTTRVVALQDIDWAVRHSASFAAMLDADCN